MRVTEVAGLKLNKAKCKFKLKQVRCLGNIIDEINVRPDPDKVAEIVNFPQPNNVIKLKRFLGMINHLVKYVPELSTVHQPLFELLKIKNEWTLDLHKMQHSTNLKLH